MNGTAQPRVLPPRYYLGNFQRLLDTVVAQYEDLLTAEENGFLTAFSSASEALQCLYVRLVSRRGPYFRAEALHYPELGDLTDALEEGLAAALLHRQEQPAFVELARILRKSELESIYASDLPVTTGWRKAELIRNLMCTLDEAHLLARWREWRGSDRWLVQPAHPDVIALLRLLFFGNGYQDLTEFVVSDLGYTNHVNYPLDPAYRLFQSRAEIDEYLELLAVKALAQSAIADSDRGTLVALGRRLRSSAAGPVAEGLRDQLRLRLARQFERDGFPDEAIALYSLCKIHPARQRLARLHKDRDPQAAFALCNAIESDPWCEEERDFARRSLPAVSKRLGLKASPLPRDQFDEDLLTVSKTDSVECVAAAHYLQYWGEACYLENLLFKASFGLAFWEEIFLPAPGAFLNPFQAAPLDMYTPSFARRRRAPLERRLAYLRKCDLGKTLLATYDLKQGATNSWIAWRAELRDTLYTALCTIPREHWLAIWERMLFDPEANRNGFPDLLLMDSGRRYRLVEVKGPGDQLQANQRRWLRFFQSVGIPASVCRVRWANA